MLTLYIKDGCPFSANARAIVRELELSCTEKNIAEDGVRDELIELGGKSQVPFLYDPEKNIKLYESDDISKYLIEEYTAKYI